MESSSLQETSISSSGELLDLDSNPVSIVLIAYYGDKWLPECLETLANASAHKNHLILVDNAGNTIIETLDLSPFDTEIIDTPHPMGFAESNNYALTHASRLENVVLFLNQDTLSRPYWIDHCVDSFSKSPELGAVSPMIWAFGWEEWDADFLSFVKGSGQMDQLEDNRRHSGQSWFEVRSAPAPALLVRTDVLRETGPFDTVFGSYYEDADLCLRVRKQGYKIGFCKTAFMAHYNGSSTTNKKRELKRARQVLRNQVIYQLRESDAPRFQQVCKYMMVEFPKRMVRGILRTPSSKPVSATMKAYWDLLRLMERLLSKQKDTEIWEAYLRDIGWPDRIPGFNVKPSPVNALNQVEASSEK